jgi:O-acetyl-ADP-ribose deacetylase (regulator of RNase III)
MGLDSSPPKDYAACMLRAVIDRARRLEVVVGDITAYDVDALVNAANERLLGGGGVDGAIHAAAGPQLLDACLELPEVSPGVRCPVGEARITPGFDLRARFVIHTVGPVWRGGNRREAAQLASAYRSAYALAVEQGLRSLAFPAISTGIFGYPLEEACQIAVATLEAELLRPSSVEQVLLVAFDERVEAALDTAVERWSRR